MLHFKEPLKSIAQSRLLSRYCHARRRRKTITHWRLMSEVEQQTQNILYNICIMLDQRRRRWAGVLQMLYKCFVFAGTAVTMVCKAKRQYLVNCKVSRYCFFGFSPQYAFVVCIVSGTRSSHLAVAKKATQDEQVHVIWVRQDYIYKVRK